MLRQRARNTPTKDASPTPPLLPPPMPANSLAPPPSRSLLFGSSSHCCLQLKMSCRHLAPEGTVGGRYYIPPKKHTCTDRLARTHFPNVGVCLLRGESVAVCLSSCENPRVGACTRAHAICVCDTLALLLHYYCVPVSWCCLSISP